MSGKSKLLIDEEPLQVIPTLAVKIGLNRAMFLQQLHYWLQKPGAHDLDGGRWIYNTLEGWHEQFPFWSAEAIRKICAGLKERGLIVTTTEYNRRRSDRTLWYTIDYDALNALLEPGLEPEEASPEAENDQPENIPEAPDQPEKSTEQPENIPVLQPEKSTERYQRVPENNYRDSDFQSGEAAKNGVPPTESNDEEPQTPKPKDLKQYAVGELMERVNAKRAGGTNLHSPTDYEKSQFGRFFERARKDGHEIDTLLLAFDYQVAKASGEIDGEPKAWCGYRTALDRVLEGWRAARSTNGRGGDGIHAAPDDEEHWRMVEENERLLAEIMAQIPREQWPSVCR